ncbi:hypothetical protein AVEN_146484-1 [Araneus ventricosus]|uniref:Uncharacterized protein n=1 Tax=Araneus ventricosus TaxID=182803 RepID=A0A4Y2NVY8_ARAVE|nr:hypothetical protein AVEN_204583-1 [Araneus ventricosus]GBN42186.1 hypothetical protein AVEN_146484-1 [Araneus ventricosus]
MDSHHLASLKVYGNLHCCNTDICPHLAPSDFHLFSHLKKFLAGQQFTSNDEIKDNFPKEGKEIIFFKSCLLIENSGRGGLIVTSRLWGRRVPGSNPIPLNICRVWGLLHAKAYVVAKRPPVGVAWMSGDGVAAQASSSSPDRGSKSRGPSQNSPRVASKRYVNATKLSN